MGEPGPGLDTTLNNVFDLESEEIKKQGYLPIEGEQHFNHNCTYKRYRFYQTFKDGESPILTYQMQLDCYCELKRELGTRSEFHFKKECHWKRIRDQILADDHQKTYLVRKCYCELPESALQPYIFRRKMWQ